MDSTKFWNVFSFYLSTTLLIFRYFLLFSRYLLSGFSRIHRVKPSLVSLMDSILSLYFRLCDLFPCSVDLDDQTTLHFWIPNHRRFDRPDLVIIHGYGGNSRWQFVHQIGPLSRRFNLYVPDLLFFGKSYSDRVDRSVNFQARCMVEGLKRLGVGRCSKYSVYGISYGGYVAYRMAENCPEEIEKVVIVSSGVGCTENQKERQLREIGRSPASILVPKSPQDLRLLVSFSMCNHDYIKWIPDFVLRQFIRAMYDTHREEKLELLLDLLDKHGDPDIPALTQETMIVWGDQDSVFPVDFAHQLYRHLSPKSRLEIIKDAGHAVNMEAPFQLNSFINSFVLAQSKP